MCSYFLFAVALRPNAGHGLLILDVSRSHTTTHHSRLDSSGRVISSSQRPLPDNTRHSQQTNIHAPVGFEPKISAGERPQTYTLDGAATGSGTVFLICDENHNKDEHSYEMSETRSLQWEGKTLETFQLGNLK